MTSITTTSLPQFFAVLSRPRSHHHHYNRCHRRHNHNHNHQLCHCHQQHRRHNHQRCHHRQEARPIGPEGGVVASPLLPEVNFVVMVITIIMMNMILVIVIFILIIVILVITSYSDHHDHCQGSNHHSGWMSLPTASSDKTDPCWTFNLRRTPRSRRQLSLTGFLKNESETLEGWWENKKTQTASDWVCLPNMYSGAQEEEVPQVVDQIDEQWLRSHQTVHKELYLIN